MIIEDIKKIKSGLKERREFGLLVGAVLGLLGAALVWKGRPAGPWMLGAGGLLAGFGALAPMALGPMQRAWMTIAVLMGYVMTRVILGIVFFGVMTPIGFIAKITGRKLMPIGFDRQAESYWVKRDNSTTDSERQF